MPTSIKPLHVCEACGTSSEDVLHALAARDEVIETLRGDIANLERDLRSKRAQIGRLRADQDAALRADDRYEDALEVLEHWKVVCSPNARELHGKRLENCLSRLRGTYTKAELMRSCDGYALKPYVVNGRRTHEGPKDAWQADAELILRDAKHVDAGLRIAERAADLRQVLAQGSPSAPTAPASNGALSPLGEAALRAARFGFSVFPCRPREKAPATPNGLLDAKRDESAIRACWTRHPHMNIGVRTGLPSGIVVLDVDTGDGGDDGMETLLRIEDKHGDLPTTASVKTPRGGVHYYFQHPGQEIRNTAGFPGPGLDIRGDGGYVLFPPSVGPGGRMYEVDEEASIAAMPDWLLAVLLKRQNDEDRVVGPGRNWVAVVQQGIDQGQRDTGMTSYVGHLFAYGMPADEVLASARVLNSNVRPPLPDRDLNRIVKSIATIRARKAAA